MTNKHEDFISGKERGCLQISPTFDIALYILMFALCFLAMNVINALLHYEIQKHQRSSAIRVVLQLCAAMMS